MLSAGDCDDDGIGVSGRWSVYTKLHGSARRLILWGTSCRNTQRMSGEVEGAYMHEGHTSDVMHVLHVDGGHDA
jgi:hypothetical protein